MRGRAIGHSQQESAQVANISKRSGRRIETGQHQPKAGGKRKGRTRLDPLEAVWINELEPMLLKPLTILRKPQNTRSTPGNMFRSSKEEKALSACRKVFRML
jgi:DNA-binding XRE family transcriptional regulator